MVCGENNNNDKTIQKITKNSNRNENKNHQKRQNSYESAVTLEALEGVETMEQDECRADDHPITERKFHILKYGRKKIKCEIDFQPQENFP